MVERKPFEMSFACRQCGHDVHLRVPPAAHAHLVIAHFQNDLSGLCKKCLKEKQE